jgi:hypothetical protein
VNYLQLRGCLCLRLSFVSSSLSSALLHIVVVVFGSLFRIIVVVFGSPLYRRGLRLSFVSLWSLALLCIVVVFGSPFYDCGLWPSFVLPWSSAFLRIVVVVFGSPLYYRRGLLLSFVVLSWSSPLIRMIVVVFASPLYRRGLQPFLKKNSGM